MSSPRGIVYLVGAGPGDPWLITVRGRELLRRADVVVHDRLVDAALLAEARSDALRIDAGKAPGHCTLTQEEICATLVKHASAGRTVVRLKGGDPFVFGRGGEELAACCDAGIPCVVVPGVSSALAAPAAAGIAVTERGVARSVAVITAQTERGGPGRDHDFAALARIDTLVVLMGREPLAGWTQALVQAGRSAKTPAVCISSATTPQQRVVTTELGQIAQAVNEAHLAAPMVAVVGDVARVAQTGELRALLPLAGRRVVLTAAVDTNCGMAEALLARGAVPVSHPLIRVVYPRPSRKLQAALARLEAFDWVAFTSRHAVIAFFSALHARNRDARALASHLVAAIGPGTADALRQHGISADLLPRVATAEGLAGALLAAGNLRQVLHPRSRRASGAFARRLRSAGVAVEDPIAYDITEVDGRNYPEDPMRAGCDAVLLCSPSAARVFARRYSKMNVEAVVALGPVTARAATDAGVSVHAVADSPSPAAVVATLERQFSCAGVVG